jgi:5-hydroxyisourate hydrolase
MSGISTHVLDTANGTPVAGVTVHLLRDQTIINSQTTNSDGRISAMLPSDFAFTPGTYKLVFEVKGPFFPEINIIFQVKDATAHYHVPLLLSPFGYSTYRGS